MFVLSCFWRFMWINGILSGRWGGIILNYWDVENY